MMNKNSPKNSRELYSKEKGNVQNIEGFNSSFALILSKKVPKWAPHKITSKLPGYISILSF